jgi:hypothetical protein
VKITQNGGVFTLEVSRPQLTRIALAIGVHIPSWYEAEAKSYAGVKWSVTSDWGNEYCEMLGALGIDVSLSYGKVGEEADSDVHKTKQ